MKQHIAEENIKLKEKRNLKAVSSVHNRMMTKEEEILSK